MTEPTPELLAAVMTPGTPVRRVTPHFIPNTRGLHTTENPNLMCGIGLIARYPDRLQDPDWEAAKRIMARLAHRGPDGAGEWMDPAGHLFLGHRRLAVIDPSELAAQPFVWPETGLVLVFNGEIY
ncbi:hypothetical protein B1B_19543, partial [mine drainage metagenome]